jgi:acetylornithine/N-succinyldiaminopimelate aminotransferase
MSEHSEHMHAPAGLARCPIMPTYGPPQVMFVRGEGSWLYDADGRKYLDLLSGLAVTSLGHAHPDVAAAIARQAGTLLHVSNLFGTPHQAPVARTLDSLITGGPTDNSSGDADARPTRGQVFFANSGAEANECAIKLARKWGGRGKHVVVSAWRSFHGRTLATLHATGQPEKHEAFQPLPEGFRHAGWNDLDDFVRVLDDSVAAILLEPVQGEGGVNPGDPAFFQGLRKVCDERGILLMVDEVQTGLGRTGKWFGFQHMGIEPDVVTMAKALGNGMPIGACWAKAEVAAAFKPGDHATTYGGQPLSTAAAMSVLEVMQRIDAPTRARTQGALLTAKLEKLPGVVGVRGLGLLLGVELDEDVLAGRLAKDIAAACLDAGVVLNGITNTALRLAPALTISDDEIDHALDVLRSVLHGGG